MPPRKQVPQLHDISCSYLSLILASSIASLANGKYDLFKKGNTKKKSQNTLIIPSKETQKIKDYVYPSVPVSKRTKMFHDVLLHVVSLILRDTKKDKRVSVSVKATMLKQAINYSLTVTINDNIDLIDMTDVLHVSMKWIDTCRFNSMSSNISYVTIENIFLQNFAEFASQIQCISSLKWPHLISAELLRLIGRNLINLKELVLACQCESGPYIEEERKDKGCHQTSPEEDLIPSLKCLFQRTPGDFTNTKPTGCPKLITLTLPHLEDETGQAAHVISEVLYHLKDLKFVTGPSILMSLFILHQKRRCTPLKLRHLYDYDPMKRMMSEISFLEDIAPDIDNINVRVSKDLTKRVMNTYTNVKTVDIEWPDFHFYAKNFSCLVSLTVALDFLCPWHLLIALSRSCKDLKILTLEHPTFQMDPENLLNPKPPSLKSLTHFKLIQSSFIEFIAFKMMIIGCPNLTVLDITLTNDRNYMVDEFTDHLIKAVCPYMKHLKKFTVECLYKTNLCLHLNCLLTITSFYSVIEQCPNLEEIGHLDSWDVTDKEVKEATRPVKRNNWKLQIL